MSKAFLSITLSLSTFFAAAAQSATPQPTRQWRKAASILPGTHILVRERSQHTPQACTLVWIDNTALACDVYLPTEHRVVYPATSVTSVVEAPAASEEQESSHLVLPLLFTGAGALLGGLSAKDAGTKAGFAGAMLGAGLGAGMGAAVTEEFAPHPRPQWAFHLPMRSPAHIRRF